MREETKGEWIRKREEKRMDKGKEGGKKRKESGLGKRRRSVNNDREEKRLDKGIDERGVNKEKRKEERGQGRRRKENR